MACYSNEDVAAGRLRGWQARVLGRAKSIADKHLVSMCKAWVLCPVLGRRNRGKKERSFQHRILGPEYRDHRDLRFTPLPWL